MKNLLILIFIIFAIPAFCQYGNMCVIEPCDFQFTSCKNFTEDGKLHLIGENYIGFFVNVTKESRVKLTFSGKGIEKKNYLPAVRLVCENSFSRFFVSDNEFNDYSANFELKKGIHFIKIENLPFPNHAYDKRELFIERVYISGNNGSYIKTVQDKDIIEAANNFVQNNMESFSVFKKDTPSIKKIAFDWGILVNNQNLNEGYIKDLKKTYNLIINEESEEYNNNITDYTSLFINDDTDLSIELNQIFSLLSNKVTIKYLSLNYSGEKISSLWNILNTLSVYNIPIQLYNLSNYNNLPDYINISVPFVKSIVFSENTKAPKMESLPIFTPKYIDKKSGKYEYKAFPGEYIFNGNIVTVPKN